MQIEIDRDSVVLEFKIAHGDKVEALDVDVCEAADLLNAANVRTKAAQVKGGAQPYYAAVRDDVLIGFYGVEDASYTMASIFARMVTEACNIVEKKTTILVESLDGMESTPANGQSPNDESGSPTDSESKPSNESSVEKSPTTGKA